MRLSHSKLFAGMAVVALGTTAVFAQPPQPPQAPQTQQAPHRAHGRMLRRMAAFLNLTPDQKVQAKSIFQQSAQSSKPIRQQMRQDRTALQAAIKAGDTNQIQQLTASIGNEQGQLAASRATAMSKLYKTLTPDQQQKFDSFHQSMHAGKAQQN